jgi:hypothetical protein
MPKISLLLALLIVTCLSAGAQTVPHPAPPEKKTVHKKTIVTKTVIINDEDADDDNYTVADEDDDDMADDGRYVVVIDEDNDGDIDDDATDMPDGKVIIHKTIHHRGTAHKAGAVYNSKYPKKLYYYNAKTGYYYKRHKPLKS